MSRMLAAMVEAALAAGDEIERIYAEGCEPEWCGIGGLRQDGGNG